MTNTTPSSALLDSGSHFLKVDKTSDVKLFKKGVPLGTPQYTYTAQEDRAYQKVRAGLNVDLAYGNK
jgi:hypothetical protein